jgi:hypothetical protein
VRWPREIYNRQTNETMARVLFIFSFLPENLIFIFTTIGLNPPPPKKNSLRGFGYISMTNTSQPLNNTLRHTPMVLTFCRRFFFILKEEEDSCLVRKWYALYFLRLPFGFDLLYRRVFFFVCAAHSNSSQSLQRKWTNQKKKKQQQLIQKRPEYRP